MSSSQSTEQVTERNRDHAFGSLFTNLRNAVRVSWAIKPERCSSCDTWLNDSSGYSISEETGDIVFSHDMLSLEPEQAERCHGCAVLQLAIAMFKHVLRQHHGQDQLLISKCYIDQRLDMTRLLLHRRHNPQNLDLEMIKMTNNAPDSLLGSWLPSLFTKQSERVLPPYLNLAADRPPISGYTGSSESFDKVFSWFKSCCELHPTCADQATMPILPTRVIDFADKDHLRLVTPDGARGRWISLSHRWIDASLMPRCTSENINRLKRRISWDSLTKTFQEAIIFAQEFSAWYAKENSEKETLRYIWIDSLCIIQDSAEDWLAESQQMCSVYEKAVLTIAAATGKDGCFSEAPDIYKGFEAGHPRFPNPRFFLRAPLPDHENEIENTWLSEETDKERKASSLELFTRGWVMQERLLSRRYVIFASNELMWECLENSDCECGQLSRGLGIVQTRGTTEGRSFTLKFSIDMEKKLAEWRSRDPNDPRAKLPMKIAYHRSLRRKDEQWQRNKRDWWRRLVETYTALQLTKETDRLKAIAGLATHLGTATNSTDYLAGHWLDGLPLDLWWHADGPKWDSQESTPADPSAPSWSWASCGGPVRMPRENIPNSPLEVYPQVQVPASVHLGGRVQSLTPSLLLKCQLFKGLKSSGGKNSQVKHRYFPDNSRSTKNAEIDGSFILIARTNVPSGWVFIHVEWVGGSLYRRIGALEMESLPQTTRIDDDVLLECFKERVKEDIEIV